MTKKHSFKYEELLDCANGKLFGPGNAKLPSPPMLMFHRITNIQDLKGKYNKGLVEAELDIKKKMWFFDCHFKDDPVMPGCPVHPKKKPTNCHIASNPRQPGITGSSLK